MPSEVCVRSFVPKEKNSASTARSAAQIDAQGNSTIVPTRYDIVIPVSAITAAAAASISALQSAISRAVAASGTITSGMGDSPVFLATAQAASKIARACIRQISG